VDGNTGQAKRKAEHPTVESECSALSANSPEQEISTMKTVRYASLTVKGEEVYGTAELVNGTGYAFRKDGERKAVLVSYKDVNLMLYGLCAVADAQYLDDELQGGPAGVACSRAMEV
jgi:hypothetical protein